MKKQMDEMLSNMVFDEEKQKSVFDRIEAEQASDAAGGSKGTIERQKKRNYKKRRFMVLVAACLCIFVLTGISFAAELPQKIISELGALFQPINETCVYDGIEMKTLGAVSDNDYMEVYFTLRDLEKNRVTKEMGIDQFSLDSVGKDLDLGITGCHQVDFDAATKTATFSLTVHGGSSLKGQKMKIAVKSIIEGAYGMSNGNTGISLYEILTKQIAEGKTPILGNDDKFADHWNGQNQGGADLFEEVNAADNILLLPEGAMNLTIPGVDWFKITNIGYEGGWVHIRIAADEKLGEINHGFFYLGDKNGGQLSNEVLCRPAIGLSGDGEYIIKANSLDELKDKQLMGSFTNYHNVFNGDWSAAFKVEGAKVKSADCNIKNETGVITAAEVSELGVTIRGTCTVKEKRGDEWIYVSPLYDTKVSVKWKDGTISMPQGGLGTTSVEDQSVRKWRAAKPIDIEQVVSVIIDGQEVILR